MHDRSTGTPLDFGQAYRKAADFCAIQDRSASEIKLKLKSWTVDRSFTEKIINRLLEEGFIDEKRFAINFTSGKFRIKSWGKIKIAAALRQKSIPANLIREAISTIDNIEYFTCLETLLQKKIKQLGGTNSDNRQKAARFTASKGFEPELIITCLKDTDIIDF